MAFKRSAVRFRLAPPSFPPVPFDRWTRRVRTGSVAAAGLCCGLALAAPAEAASKVACLDAGGYKVAYRERSAEVGSDIVVHPPGGTCSLKTGSGAFQVLKDDAAYVKGAAGAVLVLDVGTGPDRVLVLYDLAKRAELLRADYDDDVPLHISADSVAFSAITGPATPANCAEAASFIANGLTPALARRTVVSLPAGTRREEGPATCVARQ